MVAILVLATFVIFVLVDYYFQRRAPQRVEVSSAAQEIEELPFPMNMVSGFRLPAHVAYHTGHGWALKEARQVVRVGMDDFAARLPHGAPAFPPSSKACCAPMWPSFPFA